VPALATEPAVPPVPGAFNPSNEVLARVSQHLDERRLLGTRLIVSPPHYQWLSAEVALHPDPAVDGARVRQEALDALYVYLHPLRGGPDGTGWPFGRTVTSAELLGVLQRVLGLEAPESVRLHRVDPQTRAVSTGWTNKMELGPGVLPFSVDHSVTS